MARGAHDSSCVHIKLDPGYVGADFSNAIKARQEVLAMYKENIQRLKSDVDR